MTNAKRTSCILCSLGCPFKIDTRLDEGVALDYETSGKVFGGKLCGKGNFALEFINHPYRLIEPSADESPITWPVAIENLSRELSAAESVGVIIGSQASMEDIVLAVEFVKSCLPKGRIAFNIPTGDDAVHRALNEMGGAGNVPAIDDIATSSCILAIGDPFEIGPVIAGPVLTAKHAKRGNTVAVISYKASRTARFATVHFPDSERRTLADLLRCLVEEAGDSGTAWMQKVRDSIPLPADAALMNLAIAFTKKSDAVMILETQDPVTAALAALVLKASGPDKKLLTVTSTSNAAGLVGVAKDAESVEALLTESGGVDSLLVLGADLMQAEFAWDVQSALESLRFLAVASPFESETALLADMVLPATVWPESGGTYGGNLLESVIPPPGGAISYGELLKMIAGEKGVTLSTEPSAVDHDEQEPSAEAVGALLAQVQETAPAPKVRSTTVRYEDGAMTDMMSWSTFDGVSGW